MKQKIIDLHPTIENVYIEDITSLSELIDKCNLLKQKGIEIISISGSGYDGELSSVYISPKIERMETDQEYIRRQFIEFERSKRHQAMAEQQAERDRRQYEILKKKFEG